MSVNGGGGGIYFFLNLCRLTLTFCAMLMILLKEGKCDFLCGSIIKQVPRHSAKIAGTNACFLL